MLGERLKQARYALGLKQDELADASGVGQGHISRLERGDLKDIRGDTLVKLALALGVTADYLLGIPQKRQQPAATAQPERKRQRARASA